MHLTPLEEGMSDYLEEKEYLDLYGNDEEYLNACEGDCSACLAAVFGYDALRKTARSPRLGASLGAAVRLAAATPTDANRPRPAGVKEREWRERVNVAVLRLRTAWSGHVEPLELP